MILNIAGETFRSPRIITAADIANISAWIEKEVDNYIKAGHNEFGIKDLFGGNNYFWGNNNFPIQILYDKYYDKYINLGYDDSYSSEEAVAQAGIYVGWILKSVCRDTKLYTFKIRREFKQIIYEVVCKGVSKDIGE